MVNDLSFKKHFALFAGLASGGGGLCWMVGDGEIGEWWWWMGVVGGGDGWWWWWVVLGGIGGDPLLHYES